MLQYERINAVVSLTLIGLALYFVLEFPVRVTTFSILGSPLSIVSPQRWLMALLLVGLVMAGTDMVMRFHPDLFEPRLTYLATFWMLPGLIIILATQTLTLASTPIMWGAALIGLGIILWLTILADFQQVATPDKSPYWTYIWQRLIGFGVSLALFFLIYQTRSRSLISAPLIFLVATSAALPLLRQKPDLIYKTWLYSIVTGITLAQLTWALNYWRTTTLKPALLLFLTFYIFISLAQQQQLGKLSRRVLWEFGVITLVGIVGLILL